MMLIAAVLFTLLESARYCEMKKLATINTASVTESLFAGYVRPLWEEYHLLVFDATGEDENRFCMVKANMEALSNENLAPLEQSRFSIGNNLLQIKTVGMDVEQYRYITDERAFEDAVVAYMKSHMLSESAKFLYGQYEGIKDLIGEEPSSGAAVSEAVTALKEGDIVSDAAESSEGRKEEADFDDLPAVEVKENPLDVFSKLQQKGILALAVPDSLSISERSIAGSECVSKRTLSVGNFEEPSETAWTDKILLEQYLGEYLSCFTKGKENRALLYEQEYLISGKDQDLENLKAVVNQILAIREAANLLFLSTDSGKQAQAMAVAVSLAGESANPVVLEIVKWGVLAAWAYVESLLDVRALLSGGSISMIKSSTEWTSDVTGLATSLLTLGKAKNCEKGLSYEGYLAILLFMKSEEELSMRALDVMEATLQGMEHYSDFKMDRMVLEARITMEYCYPTIFLGMDGLTQGMKREFFLKAEKTYSYRKAGV